MYLFLSLKWADCQSDYHQGRAIMHTVASKWSGLLSKGQQKRLGECVCVRQGGWRRKRSGGGARWDRANYYTVSVIAIAYRETVWGSQCDDHYFSAAADIRKPHILAGHGSLWGGTNTVFCSMERFFPSKVLLQLDWRWIKHILSSM